MNILRDIDNAYPLKLDNGLRAVVIHKPELTTCCVSACIKAGHFFDPDDCPGLAHLLEHMLFMGNALEPEPNAINDLFEQAGGSINAWTGTEFANYHFQAHAQALPRLLPAFAAMLCSPDFAVEQIVSEIKSIDAEFKFKRKDDLRRLYQIHKETTNPTHPFAKFSVGNQHIFDQFDPQELKARLHAFHTRFYAIANMTLVIYSPFSVAQIVPWLTQAFALMKTGTQAELTLPSLYTKEQLGVEITITPLQTACRMIITFALPALHLDITSRPLDFISHVLGDEGSGSLFAYLKAKGWVTNLIAGSGIEGENFKDFNINLQLTASGLENKSAIVNAIFFSLETLRSALGEHWRLREKAKLNQLARQYDDTHKPLQNACDLAELLQYHDWQAIQYAVQHEALTSDALSRALEYFTTDNLRIKIIAPNQTTDRSCNYYDAAYAIRAISESQLNQWRTPEAIPAIVLPAPNPYIGDSYSVCPQDNRFATPQQIRSARGANIWFCQDHKFRVPKGDIFMSFDVPSFAQNIHQVAAKRLWLAGLNDYLQGKFYRAEIAGLHYRIYGHQGGFTLHTRGFSAQQGQLVHKLTNALFEFEPDPQTFYQIKTQQSQSLQNALLNKPINRLFTRLSVLIQRNTHAPIDLLEVVEQCQFNDVKRTKDRAFDYFHLEGLIHGNWAADSAMRIADSVLSISHGAKASPLPRAISKLPVGKTMIHEVNCDHDDAAVVLYLQAPSNDLWNVAMCMVLEQMLAGSFFSTLRTEKQLGYLVGTGYVPHNRHPGIVFYIQSPSHGPQELMSQISQFLQQQTKERAFYEGYWPNIQSNLLKQLQDVDLNQSMHSQRLWQGMGAGDTQLHRNQQLAGTIEAMTFDDIIRYATNMNLNQTFGELVLFSSGKFAPMPATHSDLITNIADFKSKVEYFL